MPLYEITFIARPDIASGDVDNITESYANIVKDEGGKIIKHEYWGLRDLEYRINKNTRGHYSMIAIDSKPETLKEIERKMRLSSDVIRYLSVRYDEIDDKPSLMMQHDENVEKIDTQM